MFVEVKSPATKKSKKSVSTEGTEEDEAEDEEKDEEKSNADAGTAVYSFIR